MGKERERKEKPEEKIHIEINCVDELEEKGDMEEGIWRRSKKGGIDEGKGTKRQEIE